MFLQVGISNRRALIGNDTLLGLHELLTYGLKGSCAYGWLMALLSLPSTGVSLCFDV